MTRKQKNTRGQRRSQTSKALMATFVPFGWNTSYLSFCTTAVTKSGEASLKNGTESTKWRQLKFTISCRAQETNEIRECQVTW